MKFLMLSIFILAFSNFTSANSIDLTPNCYKGTLVLSNGENRDVFLTLKSIENALVRVNEFKIGNQDFYHSGRMVGDDVIVFNENNDYIPGGNANFNLDINLKFGADQVVGQYKFYQFEEGHGGYGQSNSEGLVLDGVFELRKCLVKIVD
ncbi:MAG: hypothetical protein AB7I27_18385 [Bacteriovoracaceae bacterium]